MGASDLRVSVAVSRLRCVVEPALVLAHPLGLRLALGLAQAFEVWLTRSLWRTIDNSELLSRGAAPPLPPPCLPDARAMADWSALRLRTDAGSWSMRWVGDCVAESQLSAVAEAELVDRFEWLVESFESRAAAETECALPAWWRSLDLRAGSDDTVALSAALDGAMILCLSPDDRHAPWPVEAMQRRGLPAACVNDPDASNLFAAERQLVRQTLAGAGLAALMQSLPALAVVHVLVDIAATASSADETDPWSGAQTWWYRV